jgi:hypothetical protein
VDHLAEQKYPFAGVLLQCAVADLNGVFYTIAESKMTGDIKAYRAEVNKNRGEILLSRIKGSARFFYFSGNG